MADTIGLRFITGIRWYKDTLKALNNMTFIYDSNWSINNTDKYTLPVCFFHVKSCHEVMDSEISQKQMLFYNSASGATSADPSLNSGLLNVVADNIVIKPKTYKLDVVIPYSNLTLLDQSFVHNTYTAQAVTSALIGSGGNKEKALASWTSLGQPYVKLVTTLIKDLIGAVTEGSSLSDFINTSLHQPEYNKDSLEIMWRMRHIVKMKMWNSWRYKYVSIVNVDITKEGTEDGVYEATLTLQEMPIVSMYSNKVITTAIPYVKKNPALQVRGDTAIKILDVAGGQFK